MSGGIPPSDGNKKPSRPSSPVQNATTATGDQGALADALIAINQSETEQPVTVTASSGSLDDILSMGESTVGGLSQPLLDAVTQTSVTGAAVAQTLAPDLAQGGITQEELEKLLADIDAEQNLRLRSKFNTCSEDCINFLLPDWKLDTNLYVEGGGGLQLDMFGGLSNIGDLNIFYPYRSDSPPKEVFFSYDGYSKQKTEQFFTNKLDPSKKYIMLKSVGAGGGHYAALYHHSSAGWVYVENLQNNKQYSVVDARGKLTQAGEVLLHSPDAEWGAGVNKSSFLFMEASAGRLALLSEYLLRARYYGEQVAERHMEEFSQNFRFPDRPPHPHLAEFPAERPIPADFMQELMQRIPKNKDLNSFPVKDVPTKFSSQDRALLALDALSVLNPDEPLAQTLKLRNSNLLVNTDQWDFAKVLDKAGLLNRQQLLMDPKEDDRDIVIENPLQVSNAFARLKADKSYFFRVGANNQAGYVVPLRYSFEEAAWVYCDNLSNRWEEFASPIGVLSTAAETLLADNAESSWGLGANDTSMMFIEATDPRRAMATEYAVNYRNISSALAEAFADQYLSRVQKERQARVHLLMLRDTKNFAQMVRNIELGVQTAQSLYNEIQFHIKMAKREAQPEEIAVLTGIADKLIEWVTKERDGQFDESRRVARETGLIQASPKGKESLKSRAAENCLVLFDPHLSFEAEDVVGNHEFVNMLEALMIKGEIDNTFSKTSTLANVTDKCAFIGKSEQEFKALLTALDDKKEYLFQSVKADGRAFAAKLHSSSGGWRLQMSQKDHLPLTDTKGNLTTEAIALFLNQEPAELSRIDILQATPERIEFLAEYIKRYRSADPSQGIQEAFIYAMHQGGELRNITLIDGTVCMPLPAQAGVRTEDSLLRMRPPLHAKNILPDRLIEQCMPKARNPGSSHFNPGTHPFTYEADDRLNAQVNTDLDHCLGYLSYRYALGPISYPDSGLGEDVKLNGELAISAVVARGSDYVESLNQHVAVHPFLDGQTSESVEYWLNNRLDRRMPYLLSSVNNGEQTNSFVLFFYRGDWYSFNPNAEQASRQINANNQEEVVIEKGIGFQQLTSKKSLTEHGRSLFVHPDKNWGTSLNSFSISYTPMDLSRVKYLRAFVKSARSFGQDLFYELDSLDDRIAFPDFRETRLRSSRQSNAADNSPINFPPPNGANN